MLKNFLGDDDLLLTTKSTTQQKIKTPPVAVAEELQQYHIEESATEDPVTPVAAAVAPAVQEPEELAAGQEQAVATLAPDMSSFTLADNENPIFITGDDGTVYQVAGQNEQVKV